MCAEQASIRAPLARAPEWRLAHETGPQLALAMTDFDSLYNALCPRLLRAAQRMVGETYAPDIVAQTWLLAWERREQCRNRAAAWVWAIFRRQAIQHYRQSTRLVPLGDWDALDEPLRAVEVRLDAARLSRLLGPLAVETDATARKRRSRAIHRLRVSLGVADRC